MKASIRSIRRGTFALGVAAALGFGATQALAAPAEQPARMTDCTTCAQQCVEIAICFTGYCRCA